MTSLAAPTLAAAAKPTAMTPPVFGPRIIIGLVGVLLTGANEDGARGLARIKEHGGTTLIQDPHEAQVAVMPEAALALHRPDHILPLNGIGQLLAKLEPRAC